MKFLFITDVTGWDTAISVFEKEKPSIILIGGDVVSDGFANYWNYPPIGDHSTNLRIANFLRKHQSEIEKTEWGSRLRDILFKLESNELFDKTGFYRFEKGMTNTPKLLLKWIFSEIDKRKTQKGDQSRIKGKWRLEMEKFYNDLEKSFRKTDTFQNQVHKHVDSFYSFLSYTGEKTGNVYVVKGNHDNYGDYYEVDKINNIRGCQEISGKMIELDDFNLLGLGYEETHYLRKLRPLLETYSSGVDLVLTHSEEKRVKLIASLNPLLVFRGHYRIGKYKVNGIDFVSSIFPSYVTVETKGLTIQQIQYHEV